MSRVRDKVAIVTGAALGLGEASARMLAREGAKVVVTDIKDEEGERVAQAIAEAGGERSTFTTTSPSRAPGSR